MDIDVVATPEDTLLDLLDRSRRRNVPIRRLFLQIPGPPKEPGPLARFVEGRRPVALDLWLLLHAGASSDPWDVRQPAMSWARMLDLPQTLSSETTISRNWTWLEQQGLVRSERDHRVRKVFLLMEDGSRRSFSRPTGKQRGFFKLPYAYFTQRWHKGAQAPGKSDPAHLSRAVADVYAADRARVRLVRGLGRHAAARSGRAA